MKLYAQIRKYNDLEETIERETEKIFNPIVAEVERQDKKFLLFPPVINTLSVSWLVMRPKVGCYYTAYHYLLLLIQPDQDIHEIDLVLATYWNPSINEFCMEVVGENPRSYLNKIKQNINNHDEILPPMPLPDWEELKEDQTYEMKGELLGSRVKELWRVPLNKGTKPATVAKKILTNGRKIHNALKIRLPNMKDKPKKSNRRPHLRLIK